MRKLISVVVAIAIFLAVVSLYILGKVALPEYWTQLAVALTMAAIGVLYWGFKPDIDRFVRRGWGFKTEHIHQKVEPTRTVLEADLVQPPPEMPKSDFGLKQEGELRVYWRHSFIILQHTREIYTRDGYDEARRLLDKQIELDCAIHRLDTWSWRAKRFKRYAIHELQKARKYPLNLWDKMSDFLDLLWSFLP